MSRIGRGTVFSDYKDSQNQLETLISISDRKKEHPGKSLDSIFEDIAHEMCVSKETVIKWYYLFK